MTELNIWLYAFSLVLEVIVTIVMVKLEQNIEDVIVWKNLSFFLLVRDTIESKEVGIAGDLSVDSDVVEIDFCQLLTLFGPVFDDKY